MKPPDGTTDIVVTFSTPFPLYLPDTIADGKEGQIRREIQVAGNPPTAINLIRVPNQSSGIATGLELDGGDPFGRYATSHIQVRFSLTTSPEVADLEFDRLAVLATTSLNHLVEHYRDLADKPLVRRVSPADLSHFLIHYLRTDKPADIRQYATGHGPLVGRLPEDVQRLEEKIRERLVHPRGPPLFRELELRAKQLFGEGDYRGSVIETAILFECWLKSHVRGLFASRGVSPDLIEAKGRKKNGEPRSADYFACALLKEASAFDFGQTSEYTDWRKKAANVRNDLVHGTRHSVSQSEATECWDAVCAAQKLITQKTIASSMPSNVQTS